MSNLVQGFLIEGGLGWRWVFWILCIITGILSLLGLFFMPETVCPFGFISSNCF